MAKAFCRPTGRSKMSHVNSAGGKQTTRARIKLTVVTYDGKAAKFQAHAATVDVHPRWSQKILECLCCAEAQEAGLAKRNEDGHQSFCMSPDRMREMRDAVIMGAECPLSETSPLDGRVKMIIKDAIGLCEHMIFGNCVVTLVPGA